MRTLNTVFHVEVKNYGEGFEMIFHGKNSAGTAEKFKLKFELWFWKFIVRDTLKAWLSKKAQMNEEIQRTDASFPKNEI